MANTKQAKKPIDKKDEDLEEITSSNAGSDEDNQNDKAEEVSAKDKLSDLIATDSKPAKLNLDIATQGIKIPDDTPIEVKSNCFGELMFKGRDGKISWSKCGEVQTLTMKELRDIKSTAHKFFEHQWIVPIGVSSDSTSKAKPADIYKSLGILKWYKNLVEPSDFKGICNWDIATIHARIKLLSKGVKENLIVALNAYIVSGVLDSRKKIKAFEEALGVELAAQE